MPLIAGKQHVVHAPFRQQLLGRSFVQGTHGGVLGGVVHAVKVHIQRRAAEDLPPGQAGHRVQVLPSGQEHRVGGGAPVHKLGQGHAVGAEHLVIAHRLAAQGQYAGQGADHQHRHRQREAHPLLRGRLPGQQSQPVPQGVGRQQAAQQKPEIQQLDVVVVVGLEHDAFADGQHRQPARVQAAQRPSRPQKAGKLQQVHQPQVLDVKPEIVFPGAVVDPVEHRLQKAAAGAGLHEDHPEQLGDAQHPRHGGVAQPGRKLPPVKAAGRGHVPHREGQIHRAQDHQRQQAVGLHQGQTARQQAQRQPQPLFALKGEAVQKVQAGQHQRPAHQGGPLGHQQVGDAVHPADVFGHVVGGGGVVAGKNAAEGFLTAHKIGKAEAAAQEKQHRGQGGLARAAQCPAGQQPDKAEDADQRGEPGQEVGKAQRGPQHHKHAGNALAQEGVAEDALPRQQGIIRRHLALHRDALDKGQVHGHVAVAALPGIIGPVGRLVPQDVGVQQVDGEQHPRHHHRQHGQQLAGQLLCPAARHGRHRLLCGGAGEGVPCPRPGGGRDGQRQKEGGQPEAQHQRRRGGQHGKAGGGKGAAQRQGQGSRFPGKCPPCQVISGPEKHR